MSMREGYNDGWKVQKIKQNAGRTAEYAENE